MIRVITTSTARYYEQKVEEAGKVPGLKHQLAHAQENATTWQSQAADYQKQLDGERERTDLLTTELRQLRARLDDETAYLREEGKPLPDLFHQMLQRLREPSDAPIARKELALLFLERWVAQLTPEERRSPMGGILGAITNPVPRTQEQDGDGEEHQKQDEAEAPSAPAPKRVEQMLAAATLRGPDPFPGIG